MDEHIIHKTDLSFQRSINKQFGINRGIYNTIDHWFFAHGYTDIIRRRTEILPFLNFILTRFINSKGKLRMSSGCLSFYLDEYLRVKYSKRKLVMMDD